MHQSSRLLSEERLLLQTESERASPGRYDERSSPPVYRWFVAQARRKGFSDGTTALLLLVSGSAIEELSLYLCHVGDCRAVRCRARSGTRLGRV